MSYTFLNEISRKIYHYSLMIVPIFYLYFIKNKWDIIIILIFLVILSVIFEIFRKNKFKALNNIFSFIMRKNEINGHITGSTWSITASLVVIIIFPKDIAIASIIFLAVGDATAALVGIRYPYLKFKNKSISGSFSGFISIVFFLFLLGFDIANPIFIIGAFVAMIIEILPIPVNDNFSIPIFSGFFMYILDKLFFI